MLEVVQSFLALGPASHNLILLPATSHALQRAKRHVMIIERIIFLPIFFLVDAIGKDDELGANEECC